MKLFYRKYGSGEPVVILHGVFGLSDNWVTIGRRLGEHFTVYIPDQRNHGHSPHSPALNYFALADDLLEFLEEHTIRSPILIGHSMGGKVAMQFALDSSYPVKKLVVVDIAPRSYLVRQEHIQIVRAMRSIDFNIHTTRQAVESVLSKTGLTERVRYFIAKNLQRIGHERLAWRMNLDAIEENLEQISARFPSDGIYTGPVLVIKGGNSDYITGEDEPLFRRYFPGIVFKTIPHASHWVHADQPDALCRELDLFLK